MSSIYCVANTIWQEPLAITRHNSAHFWEYFGSQSGPGSVTVMCLDLSNLLHCATIWDFLKTIKTHQHTTTKRFIFLNVGMKNSILYLSHKWLLFKYTVWINVQTPATCLVISLFFNCLFVCHLTAQEPQLWEMFDRAHLMHDACFLWLCKV